MADGLSVELLVGTKLGQVGQVITLSTSTALAEIAAGRAREFQGLNPDGTMTAEGFTYPVGSSAPGAKQAAQASHVLTEADLVNGYFSVPITWPYPFTDDNYVATFGLDDEYPAITIDYAVGDEHMVTPSGFVAVVLCLGQAPIVQGAYDNFDTNTELSIPFTPAISTMYGIQLYLHPKTTENGANFAGDALQASASYTADSDEMLTLTPAQWNITALDGPSALSPPIFAAAGQPITINTTFTTYAIVGTAAGSFYGPGSGVNLVQAGTNASGLELNNPAATSISAVTVNSATKATLTVADSTGGSAFQIGEPVYIHGLTGAGAQLNGSIATVSSAPSTVAGELSHGTFVAGELVVQLGTGAQGVFDQITGNPSIGEELYLDNFAGTDNATGHWVGQTSGAVFTPTSEHSAGVTIIVAGTGWSTGTATGQTATISTFLYIGVPTNGQPGNVPPNASGVWTDTVNGGTFTPTTAPTLDTFHYHLSFRIVQLPNPPSQIGSTVVINAVAVHN